MSEVFKPITPPLRVGTLKVVLDLTVLGYLYVLCALLEVNYNIFVTKIKRDARLFSVIKQLVFCYKAATMVYYGRSNRHLPFKFVDVCVCVCVSPGPEGMLRSDGRPDHRGADGAEQT